MPSILNCLKLVSDPTRIRILNLLLSEPLSVAEIQEILAMGQSRISSQLSLLKKGGLVEDKRAGKNSVYSSLMDDSISKLVTAAGEEIEAVKSDREVLDHIIAKRRDHARAYFDKLAGKFGKDYVPGRSWKSLAEGLIKVTRFGVVADLGAGEGTLSQLLARNSQKVIAVDHSQKMVDFGRALAKEHQLANLEYRLGDLQSPPIEPASVDLVLYSQALHHASDPLKSLKAARTLLKPGGKLLVLDLLQHNFEEAKELYGDIWLGFSERELSRQAKLAGFTEISTSIVDRETIAPHFQTLLLSANSPL